MAKDLPYFKFFCSEWNDGDVTLEDMKTQGMFINVCSYYWSNECNVSQKKLFKKFRNNTNLLDSLIYSELIKIIGNSISISFLDEQLTERGKLSNQNSLNAKKRWEKMRTHSEKDANALESHSENNAIKKREEKKREEKKRTGFLLELKNSHKWLEAQAKLNKLNIVDVNKKLDTFWLKNYEGVDTEKTLNEIKNHFSNWLAKNNTTFTNQFATDASGRIRGIL